MSNGSGPIMVQFNSGVKQARVLHESHGKTLVETMDGKFIAKVSRISTTGASEADMFCPIGPQAYSREKAIKTLGFGKLKV